MTPRMALVVLVTASTFVPRLEARALRHANFADVSHPLNYDGSAAGAMEAASPTDSGRCGEGCVDCRYREESGYVKRAVCVQCEPGYVLKVDRHRSKCTAERQIALSYFTATTSTTDPSAASRESDQKQVRQSFPYGGLFFLPCFFAAWFVCRRQDDHELRPLYSDSSDDETTPISLRAASFPTSDPIPATVPQIPPRYPITQSTVDAVVVVGPTGNLDVGIQETHAPFRN